MNKHQDIIKYVNNFDRYKNINSNLILGDKSSIQKPLITIAIPTYRRVSLLKEAIDSALYQTNVNSEYEIIVVDNEAESQNTNETEDLINKYNSKRLLYYQNEKNIGMFGNLNRCIELARGEWVAFLHDDDLLGADYIDSITKILKRKPKAGAIISANRTIGNENSSIGQRNNKVKSKIKKVINYLTYNKVIKISRREGYIWQTNIYGAPTCGTIIKKEYAIKEGGFNEDFFPSSDWFFMFKINRTYKVYKSNDTLGYYRISDNESLNIDTLDKFIRDSINYFEFCKENSVFAYIVYQITKYEQYAILIEWVKYYDAMDLIKPENYNDLFEYKVRPIRLFIFKKCRTVYYLFKKLSSIIWG